MTLEILLNTLIDMGRKPRGYDVGIIEIDVNDNKKFIVIQNTNTFSIDDLCSIGSGLRQFVCEHKLYRKKGTFDMVGVGGDWLIDPNDFRYRLLPCALEQNKEQFLINNILVS